MMKVQVAGVQERIVTSDLAVKALIQDILACEKWAEHESLHRDVVKCMTAQKTAIDELECLTRESRLPSDREALDSDLEGFKAQLERNYLSLKKASGRSRRLLQEKIKKELLFSALRSAPEEEDTVVRKRRLDKEALSKKASSVTEDLVNMSQMMASQVTLSEHSLNSLVTSSATVTETQEEFKMMNSLLSQSRKLLSKYGRREVTDKVLIILALAFFFACCLYVVLKRLW